MCRIIASRSVMSKLFICHICNAHLGSNHSLVTHIKGKHLATGLYNCELCQESFKWRSQLCRHRRRYHGDRHYGLELEQYTEDREACLGADNNCGPCSWCNCMMICMHGTIIVSQLNWLHLHQFLNGETLFDCHVLLLFYYKILVTPLCEIE